mmetsp:Transcript_812/g.1133  ORF Transcript_812/g.1133 Transcript_812/m.1133 type:complete len:213 (-) Transcript_812:31-669(-)
MPSCTAQFVEFQWQILSRDTTPTEETLALCCTEMGFAVEYVLGEDTRIVQILGTVPKVIADPLRISTRQGLTYQQIRSREERRKTNADVFKDTKCSAYQVHGITASMGSLRTTSAIGEKSAQRCRPGRRQQRLAGVLHLHPDLTKRVIQEQTKCNLAFHCDRLYLYVQVQFPPPFEQPQMNSVSTSIPNKMDILLLKVHKGPGIQQGSGPCQ